MAGGFLQSLNNVPGEFDDVGNDEPAVTVKMEDGSEVDVLPSGAVIIYEVSKPKPTYENDEFGVNLADRMTPELRSRLSEELIEGVEADIETRKDLVAQFKDGIELLGTRLEQVTSPSTATRSVSRVGHPLLIETMIKYQAGAEAELLPAEGPAKVMTIGRVSDAEEQLAQDFEDDFNYFLTDVAEEFYDDTAGMLMHQAYCGNAYKKVYRDPMRERPVSESVSMLQLIVSEDAKTLQSAQRVTHEFEMTRADLRRMQIAGHYRDIDLGYSQAYDGNNDAIKTAAGIQPSMQRPKDVPYKLWETDVAIDLVDYPIPGKWENEAPDGMPLPYKVTLHKDTREVLGVWRNWKQTDTRYLKRNMYVHYGLVPSLGFHKWGFLQILGNHTRALRAIWRLLIDSGMFSCFPGGIKAKSARTATNELMPNPGEWVDVDVPITTDLSKVLMPLPYKAIDAVFVQLAEMIEQGAMRVGGTVMLETGEGRTNIPVGTIMSMVEQQTQIMAGVHKRSHRAQREELRKLREIFIENPEDLKLLARSGREWINDIEAFTNANLVPASDPNVPSHVHRIMQAWALMQIAAMNPNLYDLREVNDRVLRTIKMASPETLMVQPGAEQQPQGQDPRLVAAQQKAQAAEQAAQQRMAETQQKSQQADRDHQLTLAEGAQKAQADEADRAQDAHIAALESSDRAADRAAKLEIARVKEETQRQRLEQEGHTADQTAFGQPMTP
jgi:hypothetical protein